METLSLQVGRSKARTRAWKGNRVRGVGGGVAITRFEKEVENEALRLGAKKGESVNQL